MKHLFIINPAAGKGKALKLIPEIAKLFIDSSEEYFIEITEYPGHATEIARKYTSQDKFRVYSVGGDGTLNEVLNGIANSRSSLAIIPGGSGNDFIKTICTGCDMRDILRRTFEGEEKLVDLAKINDRYFINIASLGFDAEVANKSNQLKKVPGIPGKLAYILGIIATISKNKPYSLSISIDGKQFCSRSLLIAIANGKYYGGGMLPTPNAKINDGELDICLIEKMSRLKILFLFPKFMQGKHEKIKEVSFYRGKNIEVKCDIDIAMNIDGEVKRVKKASFTILSERVSIVIPSSKVQRGRREQMCTSNTPL